MFVCLSINLYNLFVQKTGHPNAAAAPEGPEMSDLVHSAEPTTDSNDTSGSGPLATDMMEQEVSNHHHPQRRTRRVYSFIYIYVAS